MNWIRVLIIMALGACVYELHREGVAYMVEGHGLHPIGAVWLSVVFILTARWTDWMLEDE